MNITILLIFIASYVLFLKFPERRAYISVASAIVVSILGAAYGVFPLKEIILAVNWNVMGILVGTMFLAELFSYSKAPAVLAERMVNRAPNVGLAFLLICIMSSVISAFVENVATVLIVAPVAFAICKKVKVNPIIPIIGIAIASNLQGTATLIGDPPSMLLAAHAKLGFNQFFIFKGKMGIFFAVQVGAVFSFFALWLFFRKHRQKINLVKVEKVRTWIPVILLGGMVVLLALSSLADPYFSYMAGGICMILGLMGFLWYIVDCKKKTIPYLKSLDWETVFFLLGIFILVGALTEFGWIDRIALGLDHIIGQNLLLAFIIIIAGSVAISAVVDNVPYLAAMIPVAQRMADAIEAKGTPDSNAATLLLFGLLIGSCLGGNITPVGASANIVGIGLLKKEGCEVRFMEFVKVGLTFTLAAVIPSAIFLWFVWA